MSLHELINIIIAKKIEGYLSIAQLLNDLTQEQLYLLRQDLDIEFISQLDLQEVRKIDTLLSCATDEQQKNVLVMKRELISNHITVTAQKISFGNSLANQGIALDRELMQNIGKAITSSLGTKIKTSITTPKKKL